MGNKKQRNKLTPAKYLTAISLFTILTVIFTWPMVINFNGVPGGDAFVFTHCYWWYKKALFSLQNPFFTNYIFYPEGVNLAFQSGTFGNFLLTLPVTLFAGPVAGVNVSYFLTFVLSATFTFLLAYRITKDMSAALVAAFLYTFSVMHAGRGVGHLNVCSIHCLPAVLYALYRALEQRSWLWTGVCGIFFGLTILIDQLQTIIVAGASTAVFVWCLMNHKFLAMRLRDVVYHFALIAGISLIVASPYLYAVVRFMGEGTASLERGMFDVGGSNTYSADLLGFILHPSGYGVIGKQLKTWFPGIMEPSAFLGLTVIVLLLVQIFSKEKNHFVRKLWLVAAIPFVLSLGPTLHIGGRWQWWSDGSYIKLPYYYLARLPLFAQIRTPDRFHIATSFAVALIAAFALITLRRYLADRFSGKTVRLVIASLMILMVAEYLLPTGLAHPVPDSPVLKSMAREPSNDPLLWLPLSRSSSFARNGLESSIKAMYFQTIHGKPILNGMLSRVSEERLEFNDPLLDMMVMAGNMDRMNAVGNNPNSSAGELDQVCRQALSQRAAWQALKEKYQFSAVVIQAPFSQPGWATRRFIDCLTGQPLVEEPQSGLSFMSLK